MFPMMLHPAFLLLALVARPADITSDLERTQASSKGRLGAAIVTAKESHFLNKNERFSLQSVMKLMVAMAALDQVDQGKWRRDQKVIFKRADLSLSHQPIVDLLGKKQQITVTLDQCIVLMVTQSCSGAADFIIRKMGGTSAVNAFLTKKGIQGMSVDRQERDLQTQIKGLAWKPEYVDEARLDAAIKRVPEKVKDAAYSRYLSDPRDTTTPAAMACLLQKLVTGKLLSPSSTRYLLSVMERTETGPDRLLAGVPTGWKLGHKTGTSSTHKGVAGATNDVGIARNAAGEWVILVALLKSSTLDDGGRAAVLANVSRVAFKSR